MSGYRERLPHLALRPFVDRLWTSEHGGAGGAAPQRILPDGCIDILVGVGGEGRARVVGTMTRPFLSAAGDAMSIAAVRFRPGGAAPFLRVRADELTDRQIAAADLGRAGTWFGDAGRAIAGAGTLDAAVRRLEGFLLARLGAVAAPDPLVAHAVGLLFAPAAPPVALLARRIGWSRQHLARSFREEVGLGPKQLARVARVQRAIAALQGRDDARLAAMAANLGYFDEAHMARDFRAFVGLTPLAVRQARGSIFPIRSLLVGS